MKNRIRKFFARNREVWNTRTARIGGYSLVLSVIVLAILAAVNVFASALPSSLTQHDISAAQLYSVTSSTKVVVKNLEQDVTIYWITQNGKEDSVVEKLLDVYDELSDHLTVVKKNPDIYPTFAKQYTSDVVYNNSLVVESGSKSRFISYTDIYKQDNTGFYYAPSAASSFDGEGAITAAIDYVVSEELPQLYVLTGHGEKELPESFQSALKRDNMETVEFSLLTEDGIPEEADVILIYAPTSDLSETEVEELSEYVKNGGRLLVFSGPQEETELANLKSLLTDYGISAQQGIVVEEDRGHYAFGVPYILLPELMDTDITRELSENNRYVLVPLAQGLSVEEADTDAVVTPLLATSDTAFSKAAGYALETYEWEDGDTAGPFSLAVSVEDASGGQMVWIGSDEMLEELYNSYSSGANTDFVMNVLSWMIGESDAISIRSKSLDYSYLTISASSASVIKAVLIGVLPLAYFLYGVDVVLKRRRKA